MPRKSKQRAKPFKRRKPGKAKGCYIDRGATSIAPGSVSAASDFPAIYSRVGILSVRAPRDGEQLIAPDRAIETPDPLTALDPAYRNGVDWMLWALGALWLLVIGGSIAWYWWHRGR